MTTEQPPSGGRTRLSVRQNAAPAGHGWDPMERRDWEVIAAVLPPPWPLGAQRHDLRYWASRQRARLGDRPGYRALAERWGVSEKAARLACADVEWWADPRFGDEDPSRAHQGRTKGARRAHQGRTEGAPDHDSAAILDAKGRTEGAPRAHQGRTEGAPRAPKDNRDTNTDTNTDIIESTSAPPPAAGAAQLSLLSGGEGEPKAKPPKPSKAAREVEAAEVLFARLERLRLERYRRLGRAARGLSAEAWLPKIRRALAKGSAGDIEDGWVWLLAHPDAAWHRGEDRGGSDRCTDYAMLLAHPEYAARRTWTGPTGLTTIEQEEVAAWLASGGRSADAPAWRERMRAAGAAVPRSEEEDDGLVYGGRAAGGAAGATAAATDDGWVCPF